ncbi:MAG: gluconokinase [Cyclobacteriaceae bacterium]|nr:gluconokinase [Cyclobacteriaceae bacterium]
MSNSALKIILAIDIGTSSVKALAIDHSGNEIFAHQLSYSTHHPQPGYSEQDPEEIYRAVTEVITRCPSAVKQKISAISFSSAMHSVMAVDINGLPLTPLIIWSDLRSKEESRSLRTNSAILYQLTNTGTPIHPMSPLCKLMWVRSNWPVIFERTHKFIGIKEFIWFKLFHQFEIDQGIASATGLLKTGTFSWYKDSLSLAGISVEKFSKPVSVYHHETLADTKILHDLGFEKPVTCVIGSSDGCLAHLGSFAFQANALSLTIGTSGAVRWTVQQKESPPKPEVFRYHLDEHNLIEGGAINNGAVLLEWFSSNFLNEPFDARAFVQRASRVVPGAEGLIFLPYVFGERAPIYNPEATGTFVGIRPHHTSQHFMRAILESIGYALCSIVDQVDAERNFTHLVTSGGFAQSHEWVQILADIFGKPMHINQYDNASALGAAMIGFKALGIDYTVSSQPVKVLAPDSERHDTYRVVYEKFRELSNRFSDQFSTLSGDGSQ